MDIVDRLKIYIEHLGIASSQFADAASIPRPTLSQLLNGRNKKVSNEFITKIHEAYPALNVVWLLFGSGDMESAENIQISEAKNVPNQAATDSLFPDLKEIDEDTTSSNSDTEKRSNNFYGPDNDLSDPKNAKSPGDTRPRDAEIDSFIAGRVSCGDNVRKVQSIMIFYSDSSFETFYPSNKQQ